MIKTFGDAESISARIAKGSLSGNSDAEYLPCPGCHTRKVERFEANGNVSRGVIRGVVLSEKKNALVKCKTDAFKEAREADPDLTMGEFEEHLEPYSGRGPLDLYVYRKKKPALTKTGT